MTVWQVTSDFDMDYYSLEGDSFVAAPKPMVERTESGRRYRIVGDREQAWWSSEMSKAKLFWYVNKKRPEVVLAGCLAEPGPVDPAPEMFVPGKPRAHEWNKKFGVFQVRQYAGPVVRTVTLTPMWTYDGVGATLKVEWNMMAGLSELRPMLNRAETSPRLLTQPGHQWSHEERRMNAVGLQRLTDQWLELVRQPHLTFGARDEMVDVRIDRTSMNFDPGRLESMNCELMENNVQAFAAMREAWDAYCKTVEAAYGVTVNTDTGWAHDLHRGWQEGAIARGAFPAPAETVTTAAGIISNITSHTISVDPVTGEFAVQCRSNVPRQVLSDYELARFKEEMTGVDILGPYVRKRSREICEGE